MIFSEMKSRIFIVALALACVALPLSAQKKKDDLQKPMAGPRATALQITSLYISPDTNSQRVDRVQIGRELVVAERSGPWLRIYANTDIEELQNDRDTPMVGEDETPPPISGWVEAKGIVDEHTSNGDQVIMGTAANEEALASDPRGPANAAQSARLLYRRVMEMFPDSPLAGEAAWRSADIHWQMERADNASLPSSHERKAYLRPQADEDDLKKVIKHYPGTRWAALAAFDLLDNRMCGDWQGSPECPAKEAEIYEKYADEFPDGPRTAQALYQAVYRLAALSNIEHAAGNDGKSKDAHARASALITRLREKFATSDYTWRAGALVYKLDQGIPVYGIDLE